MSKKRPSKARAQSLDLPPRAVSKWERPYWRRRLFKNTYTHKGRRFQIRNWCVKIQHLRQRRTLSLTSSDFDRAAAEACQAYRRIVLHGWDGAGPSRGKAVATSPSIVRERAWGIRSPHEGPARLDAAWWKQRLIHRHYRGQAVGDEPAELSVRIEHEQTGYYFPLGTDDRNKAAEHALRLHKRIIEQGWESTRRQFRCELTLAFHWRENPLAWTYTTIHSRPGIVENPITLNLPQSAGRFQVVLAESDAGIRQALAECVGRMEGFCAPIAPANATEAFREICRRPGRLLLSNQNLAEGTGRLWLEKLRAQAPGTIGLLYSVHEDSEELFRTTPGGASAYVFRRTPPTGFLEPLREVLGTPNLSPEEFSHCVWRYFKSIVDSESNASLPDRLTGLSQREHEVLALLSKGYPDKLIADRLRISAFTVHGHVRNIFEKLGVHNRVEAVVKYFQK